MVELDHSTLPQPEPQPAVPILASHLLQLEQKQRTRFTRDGRPERLSTHCEDIDEILGGGIERGIVMGISAEGIEGRLISLHLLASILLSHLPFDSGQKVNTKATVIDSTGSFSLHLLAGVLKSRIISSHALSTRTAIQTANHTVSGPAQPNQIQVDETAVEKEVQQCLQMIAITRVFDIEGLWEVLGEIGHDSPVAPPSSSSVKETAEGERKSDCTIQSSPDWLEINDSQEEDSPDDDYNLDREPTSEAHREKDEGIEIIIVDNMTQIINELFSRKEKSEAHHLLTLLSRQIHTLSSTHNILTILHNTTTSSKPNPQYPHPYTNPPNLTQKPKSNHQPTSIFSSNPLKPALGSIFSQFPSLHIFASSLPKTREDAEVLYGRNIDDVPLRKGMIGFCVVVEVLWDEVADIMASEEEGGGDGMEKGEGKREKRKFGYREQRWCAVEVDAGGVVLRGAFGMRGGMRGMGLERRGIGRGIGDVGVKGSTETEVGNVAKIWGFGGRRV